MYALERKVYLKTGRCPRYGWIRYGISANQPLLEQVRAGQPRPMDWRVVAVPCSVNDYFEMHVHADAGQPAA